MNNNITLMLENEPVLEFNFKSFYYKVFNNFKMPYGLKGLVIDTPTRDDNGHFINTVLNNQRAITSWLGNRVLNLSRSNAKKLYNVLNIDQVNDDATRCKIALLCNAVSILDNYWLRLYKGPQTWEQINIRHNSLNESIAQIALHGTSISVEGSLVTPELTTDGVYPKAWRRHKDGTLWLYKADQIIQGKSMIEVMCSNLMDKMNVQHCHYEAATEMGKQLCRCKALTDDKHSIISANTLARHCKNVNVPFVKTVMDLDRDAIYKMCIVDYLIANGDRHSRNWGFLYRPRSMELIGCHPLFDHNNAFDEAYLVNRDAEYKFNNRPMIKSAKSAMEDVDFHFTKEITEADFLTAEQYEEFMWRANDLGIRTYVTYEDRIIHYLNKYNIPLHISEVKSLLPKVELEDVDLESAISDLIEVV